MDIWGLINRSKIASNDSQLADITKHLKVSRFLKTAIKANKSFPVLGIGDSSMSNSTYWLAQCFKDIGVKYGYNVKHALFNYTKKDYDAWENINAVDEDMHLRVVAGASRQLKKTDIAITSPDFNCEVKISLDTWATGTARLLFGRYGAAGARCWYVTTTAGNTLSLYWTEDGTNLIGAVFNTTSIAANVDGQAYWYKFTLDVDDGAGHYVAKCWTSLDGSTWTLAQTITGGTTTSIYDHATQPYSMGGGATSTSFVGKVYEFRIRDGIDARNVCPQPVDSWSQVVSDALNGVTVAGTPTIYIYNGAVAGYDTGLATADIYFLKAVPNLICPLLVESLGYNESYTQGITYITNQDTLIAKLLNSLKYPIVCMIAQAPTIAPASFIKQHSVRASETIAYANLKGYDVISFYEEFLNSGIPIAELVEADGLHPNATKGQPLMKDIAIKYFDN